MFRKMLITGCGGDIAQSLARIARQCTIADHLIGSDIRDDHNGAAFFDICVRVPPPSESGYLEAMSDLVSRHGVDVIVPMSEADIEKFLELGSLSEFAGIPVVAANETAIKIGLDKYATFRMLDGCDLEPPWTAIVGEEEPHGLPCIIKPRRGRGGRGVKCVMNAAEVAILTKSRVGDIWQEFLRPEQEEYTCGLFRSRAGETRTIIFRRELRGGMTHSGEVAASPAIDVLLRRIAAAVDLVGSINVQLRLTEAGPRVFEINSRFSSTVGLRHKLGFRDFIWALQERLNLGLEPYTSPRPGIRFYRTAEEFVVHQSG